MRLKEYLVIAVTALSIGAVPIGAGPNSTFDQRKAEILDFYSKNISMFSRTNDKTGFAKSGIYHAMACYETGDIAGGNEITTHVFNNVAGASMFLVMAGMDIHCRYGQHMDAALKAKIRSFVTSFAEYPFGSTENHYLMSATGGYLASEYWPDWSKAASVKTSTRNEIYKFVTEKLGPIGIAEYDSPTYYAFDINCLLSLYEFAKDPEVRKRALAGLEIALADMAGEWVGGCWASATLRTHDMNHDAQDGTISGLTGYLYFGGPNLPSQSDGAGVLSAVSSYRLPKIIEIMGTDRSQPFTHRETHLAWHGARKTTFCNKTYGVYSQHDGNGSLFWSDQMHRAGVTWSSDKPGAKFVVKNGKSGIVGENALTQILQHNGVLVGVAKESMTGYVPLNSSVNSQKEEDGWLFLDAGTVFIAFKSAGGYSWGAEFINTGVDAKYLIWDHSNFVENYRTFTLNGGNKGWVIQTAHPNDFADFNAFVAKVKSSATVDISGINNSNPQIKYTTISGDVLDMTWDGRGGIATDRRKVNGTALDFANWPRMDNPWVKCALNGSSMVMSKGNYSRTYDYSSWTITESGSLPSDIVSIAPNTRQTPLAAHQAGVCQTYSLTGRVINLSRTASLTPAVIISRSSTATTKRVIDWSNK